MFDPTLPPPPRPTEQWMSSRRDHLVREISRRRRVAVRGRVTALGGGFVAASAAATIALATGPTAAQAFGGWASTPTTASAAQLTAAHNRCAGVGKGGTLVLTDTRGPYTVQVFSHVTGSTTEQWMCITGPSFEASTMTTVQPTKLAAVAAGKIGDYRQLVLVKGRTPYQLLVGKVGAGVTAVTLVRPDGKTVNATVDNGYFVAWWPGSGDTGNVTTARVTTASGTTTQHLRWVTPIPGNPKGCVAAPPPAIRIGSIPAGKGHMSFHVQGSVGGPAKHAVPSPSTTITAPKLSPKLSPKLPPNLPPIAKVIASGGKALRISGIPVKQPLRLACAPFPPAAKR